jgi:hypothetical protein
MKYLEVGQSDIMSFYPEVGFRCLGLHLSVYLSILNDR